MGGLVGWALACDGNTCAITSRWYIPVIIGAILGLMWQTGPSVPKEPDAAETEVESEASSEE